MKIRGSEWPAFDLMHALKNTKSSKKVIFPDRLRNDATIQAIRYEALLSEGVSRTGFSIIDNASISLSLDTYQLKGTRRQLQHYTKAPAWRNVNEELEAILYQLALHEQGLQNNKLIHRPFTLNVTPEFSRKAMSHQQGFYDYCKRRIDKAFKSELDCKPQYWFTIEFAPVSTFTRGHQRPHLHGSILLNSDDTISMNHQKTPVSRAFHKAVGKCDSGFSNHLLDLGSYDKHSKKSGNPILLTKVSWAGYCLKHKAMARAFLNKKGNLLTDNQTKKRAKMIHSKLLPSKKLSKPISSEIQAAIDAIKW